MLLASCLIAAAIAVIGSAASARKPPPAHKVVLKAIARQEAKGHITPGEAARFRSAVNRAALLSGRLPPSRSTPLASQLRQAAAIAPKLTAPRARALFGQIEANDNWFARHGPPPPRTDITDSDGVVYRYFAGKGFEFHPLGNFAALNAAAASRNVAATQRLALALADRGVPAVGGATDWEYYFDYGGGRAPWLSGFAQAVAAQSFARAAALDPADAPRLLATARAAFKAIPGRLTHGTGFGPWIRLYSFNNAVVLNAQLQSEISLADYAKATGDSAASTLASAMKEASARALPSFSSGYWSYYQLPSKPSPLSYHVYVVGLLQSLARSDPRFAATATEFADFQTEPPRFKLAASGPGAVTFWVSKPSTVRLSALGRERRLSVGGGWHTASWTLPSRAGIFPVAISATDWAGNDASVEALPIVRVASPPKRKKPAPSKPARTTASAALTSGTPLTVGAGLDQPEQANLALQQGFGSVWMTLIWPAGATVPDPGAITALKRLPAGTNLVLSLYASPLPLDEPGRAALASYASLLAQQVPALRDLVLAPAPAVATAGGYESALASIYDAVKLAAPSIRVDGTLDGEEAPKSSLGAVADAFRANGRPFPLMDALAFHPASATGKNRWALADLGKVITALDSGFGGSAQQGASLPLILTQMAVLSEIPAAKIALYSSPAVGTTGLDEPDQAAAYASALHTAECRPTVIGVMLDRLVDAASPGAQTGLYYIDGSPKTSLPAVAQAVTSAQSATRTCSSAGSVTTTTTTTGATQHSSRPAAPAAVAVGDPAALVFPAGVSVSSPPSVRVGCTAACLYLVTMERESDGAPVLARRGAMGLAGQTTVRLPTAPIPMGSYRFAVRTVAAANPGPITVDRSAVVTAR